MKLLITYHLTEKVFAYGFVFDGYIRLKEML